MTEMVPEKILEARTASFGISHLLSYKDYEHRDEYAADARWLFDTILPPFQRELVWDHGMMARFVESIWKGVDIGRYVVNDAQDAPHKRKQGGGIEWHPTDRWLIDGQQRLTAIQTYLDDGFAIKGADGMLHMWSDLPKVDQRHFGAKPFDRGMVRIYDEHDLRVLYDTMNFGGIPHRADQRALPEDDKEWTSAPGRR
jgi:hypothetical protein